MDLRSQLSLDVWDTLSDTAREAAARAVETRVPRAKFQKLAEFGQGESRRSVALFDVDGVEMALVPGGKLELGFEPEQLDESATIAWSRSFQEEGHTAQQVLGGPDIGKSPPADLLAYLRTSLSKHRKVELEPFLLETTLAEEEGLDAEGTDPHLAMFERARERGFRVPTADEWEHACSGGTRTLFPWGSTWPVDTDVWDGGEFTQHREPNAFGLTYGVSPYESEIVNDPEELHHGDGGSLVCGTAGPIAWVTFASAYRYRLGLDDDRDIWFEQTHARRALSIFPKPGEDEVRRYCAPTVLDNPDLAVLRIREALGDHDGFVLEGADREEFRGKLPDLDAIAKAHTKHASVHASIARALRKLGMLDEAEAAARRGLALEKTFDTLTALAAAHRAKGEMDLALQLLDETARVDETDASSSIEAGDLLAQQGRYAEAAARFARAYQREPASGYAQVMAPYTLFKATGDPAAVEALGAIVAGPAKGVDWVAELYDEIRVSGEQGPLARPTKPPTSARPLSSAPPRAHERASAKKAAAKSAAKAPAKKPVARKTASAKKPVAKNALRDTRRGKSVVKKSAAKKSAAAAKKSAVKKSAVKKSAVKKSAVKKSAAKKSAVKKSAAKKSAAKKSAVKKSAVKKSAAKKSAAKSTLRHARRGKSAAKNGLRDTRRGKSAGRANKPAAKKRR